MINGSSRSYDLPPPKFLQIKQDDKFFSRLLSKERSNSKAEASFSVLYYGGAAGSIPFTWESQPGTPKHPFSDNSLPPLTPPPSYQFRPSMKAMRSRHTGRKGFLHSIFSRKKSDNSKSALFSPSSSSSLSYSSSHSLPSTPMNKRSGDRKSNNGMARSRSAVHLGADEEDDQHEETSAASPTSTLRFGAGIKLNGNFGGGGKYPMKNAVKRAFSSIGRHGGTANN